ncbi:MAG: flavin reductase family protein [Oscillospiraceae bacterium]|nr:flavin reductase family protein [Oscillospiraceae bacterium]
MNKVKIPNYPMVCTAPVVLAGALVAGKPNYATIGAFGFVCEEPVFYISLKSTHHTTKGVRETGFFSVNLPSAGMLAKVDYCGKTTGGQTDKSGVFTSFYDEMSHAPMIAESPMNYLCKVIQTTSIKGFEVFFGEIAATFAREDCLTDGKPDPIKISPPVLVGPAYYSLGETLGRAFQIPQAESKRR